MDLLSELVTEDQRVHKADQLPALDYKAPKDVHKEWKEKLIEG